MTSILTAGSGRRGSSRLPGPVAALTCASLLLTLQACTGEPPTAPPSPGDATTQPTQGAGRDTATPTPLVDELVFGHTTPESFAVLQRATGECMAARDLPYVVETYLDDDATNQAERSTVAWRTTYGFGISTSALLTEATAQALVDTPNEDHAATLPPRRHLTYVRRLAACRQEATELVFAQQAWFKESLPPAVSETGEALASFTTPALVAESERWAECMRSLGHDFDGPVEAQQELFADHQSLSSLTDQSDPRILALQKREISISLDDLECSIGMQATLDEVKQDLERELTELAPRTAWMPETLEENT